MGKKFRYHREINVNLVKAVNALLKENLRYQKALADIAHGPVGVYGLPEHAPEVVKNMVKIAQDALKG